MNVSTLPADVPAEQVVLGSMLLSDEAVGVVRDRLGIDDFSMPAHRRIAQAIFGLADAGEPTEAAAVAMHLRDRNELQGIAGEGFTGQAYLDRLLDATPGPSGAAHYAQRVRDCALRRQMICLCQRGTERAADDSQDAADLLREFQQRVYELTPGRRGGGVALLSEAVEEVLHRAERVKRGEEPVGIMTGFAELDNALGGFQRADLVTLAADTAGGKTSFACAIAANVAQGGGAVLVVSREMARIDLGKRFLQARAGVPGHRLRFARLLRVEDWTALQKAAGEFGAFKLALDDHSATVGEISASARQMTAKWGCRLDLLIVDYVQLLHGRGDTRAQEVSGLAWGLKELAMDLGTPVLMLSQLNRAGVRPGYETDRPRLPTLHDLKETGDLECHSNSVILLHRLPNAQVAEDGSTTVSVKVAKARDGAVTPWEGPGSIRLRWLPALTRFEPWEGCQ